MEVDEMLIAVKILFMLSCLSMVVSILAQSGKSAGISGAIGGGAEQFLGKTKARQYESLFDKISRISAAGFILLALAVLVLEKTVK
jgi:preprotein translocase subunit SecG